MKLNIIIENINKHNLFLDIILKKANDSGININSAKLISKSNKTFSLEIIIRREIDAKPNELNKIELFKKWFYALLNKNKYFIEDNNEWLTDTGFHDDLFRFEKNNDVAIKKLPKFIYHFTTEENLKSILTHGLIPKANNKIENHPKRIFCLTTKNKKWTFEQSLLYHSKTNFNHLRLIKIDTSKINNKFYLDNDTVDGIYTNTKINPIALTLAHL